MIKATSLFIAAIAAVTLLGCSTSGNPSSQASGATSGYGTPGATSSESSTTTATPAPAPKTNNTLATPSVAAPAAQ
jgi:hypothetical protein